MLQSPPQQAKSAHGLSSAAAAELLERYGPNEIVRRPKAASALAWLWRLVADPMVLLLAAAGATYAVLGDRFDAIVTASALLPIFAVTAILEYRADRALERLNDLAPPRATVLRDGVEQRIPAALVVPGDVLVLHEGDVLAADGTVIESTRLQIDESALTGESLPVHKTSAGDAALRAGTIVRSGRGMGIVQTTGAHTEYGRIAGTLSQMKQRSSPIERAIHRLVLQIGIGVVVICGIVVFAGRAHGDAWGLAIIAGISLAMAAVPEELPMVYTLYLALGSWRLARRNALVRRLSSVETLGSTSVICVDKTGTLTHGTLSIDAVYCADGYSERDVLSLAAAASDPSSADPLDAVLLARNGGASVVRTHVVPFDPSLRYSAAAFEDAAGKHIAVKGAYEALRESANDASAEQFLHAAAARGARVLAVASSDTAVLHDHAVDTRNLHFAGLIAFADPVRADARGAVEECKRAGIRLIMITGDHAATAHAIAAQVGIAPENVRARVRPEDKWKIVQELHAQGAVVAMTGDGTNDALALREADIGIAMGKSGTEVARGAADLVLLDDDVTTIVHAIEDGRRIYANMQHAFSYLNAFHAPLLLTALLLPLLGLPILLLPVHLIVLELIVHPTSALVFENDPPDPDAMNRPPRDARSPLISAAQWRRTALLGVSLSLAVLGIYLYLLSHGVVPDMARAAALLGMLAGQMTLVFVERAAPRRLWETSMKGNRAIAPVVVGTALLTALCIWYAPVAHALHLLAPPLAFAAGAIGIGVLSVTWTQIQKKTGDVGRPPSLAAPNSMEELSRHQV